MNIQCPKCQFSQPQDQYCAQCGVDISRYTQSPSTKAKTLALKLSIPVSLVILGAISLTYKSKLSCPPVCEGSQQFSTTKPLTSTRRLKSKETLATKQQKQIIHTKRKVSSLNEPEAVKISKLKGLLPTKSAFKKILSFTMDAQLIRFSKNLTDLTQENLSLKILPINDDYLKAALLENSEILNDFTEQDIKKALKTLKISSINSKGLKLIILNKQITQPEARAKIFFKTLNLDLESLQGDKDLDTFIAILINVH